MHRALLISEVLGFIVGYLAEDIAQDPQLDSEAVPDKGAGNPGRQALAALASTCRTFSEPALNTLWRTLHSLLPFILCSPASALYALDAEVPPFSEEDWSIVLRYAPRVQELMLENDELSAQILQSSWFRTTLLLPNLRKLRWVQMDDATLASIRLLLSPSLVHLHIGLEDDHDISVLAFLESYHTFCPNLKSLHFGHSGRSPHVTTAVSRAISRSPNLEILSCNDIDETALIHVAESRCLKRFSCGLLNHQPDDLKKLAGYGTFNRPPFQNLRFLELRVGNLSSTIPLLKPQHQPFEEVSFEIHLVSPPEVFHELFTALSSATRRGTLRCITALSTFRRLMGAPRVPRKSAHPSDLQARRDYNTVLSAQPVNFQVLGPLTTLNLHKLDINIDNPISLTDDDLVQLVQGWPLLEHLNLNQRSRWKYIPSLQFPTLRGLLLLLARCPKLLVLGLGVDATCIPSLSDDEASIRNTAITELSVAITPIQEPVTGVAHFLLEHLPSLIAVPVRGALPIAGERNWESSWMKVDKEIRQTIERCSSPEWSDD